MQHEKNLVFPILFYKFGTKVSSILQFIIEIMTILLIVNMFDGKLVLSSISVVSLMFGLAHLDGYVSNVKTIKKIMKKKR